MARQYGSNTDAAKEAAAFAEKERAKNKNFQRKVEIGLFIFFLVFGMIILFNKMSEASDIADESIRLQNERQRKLEEYAHKVEEFNKQIENPQEGESETEIEVDASTKIYQRWLINNSHKAGEALAAIQNGMFDKLRDAVAIDSYNGYNVVYMDTEEVTRLLQSDEKAGTYLDKSTHKGIVCEATKAWGRDLPLSNDYEWIFDTDFDFENSYIDDSLGLAQYNVREMGVVFLCYAKSDVKRKHLMAFATAKYNCPTTAAPDGYFSDIKVYKLTGWGMTDAQRVKHGNSPLAVGAFDDMEKSAPASVSIEPEGGDNAGGLNNED